MSLYAFDGTWNDDRPNSADDTNVVWFHDAYAGRRTYIEGIGAKTDAMGRVLGGALGVGGRGKVTAMLERFYTMHAPGDRVDVVGFSRGAALALDFCNRLPSDVSVTFLGLWDCVPSFGVSWLPFDRLWGWRLDVSGAVQHCAHAMAIDECRTDFQLRRPKASVATRFEEVWFRGVHCDIGGGSGDGRAPLALAWMFARAAVAGVPLDSAIVQQNAARIQPTLALGRNGSLWLRTAPRRPKPGDAMHHTVPGTLPACGLAGPFSIVDDSGVCLRHVPTV